MFELDEKFFEEIGVNRMPENEREELKKHIQEEVEIRVGERISDGIPVEKLDEFEMIVDSDAEFIDIWLRGNAPDYESDDIYKALLAQNDNSQSVKSEYAAMKWLQINRPDFTQIVAIVMDEMKGELRSNIDKIVG